MFFSFGLAGLSIKREFEIKEPISLSKVWAHIRQSIMSSMIRVMDFKFELTLLDIDVTCQFLYSKAGLKIKKI